jgi:hypothetical protein
MGHRPSDPLWQHPRLYIVPDTGASSVADGVGGDIVDGVGGWLGSVDDDVADECAVEKGFDAENEFHRRQIDKIIRLPGAARCLSAHIPKRIITPGEDRADHDVLQLITRQRGSLAASSSYLPSCQGEPDPADRPKRKWAGRRDRCNNRFVLKWHC